VGLGVILCVRGPGSFFCAALTECGSEQKKKNVHHSSSFFTQQEAKKFFSLPPFLPPTKHILITMLALRASAASAVTVRPTTANKTMRVWKAENNSEFPPLAGPARRSKESGEKKRMK
jgi:hypothetical protein